jgi:hypothetical protein
MESVGKIPAIRKRLRFSIYRFNAPTSPPGVLLGILQTPHCFRAKRQLWTYSSLGIGIHSSADHEMEKGPAAKEEKTG